MVRPFAWLAAIAAVVAALCVFLPWHTIVVSHPLPRVGGGADIARMTHTGIGCGLHGIWLLVLAGLAALGAAFVGLGRARRMSISPCRILVVVALLLAAAALLAIWDLFRDSTHCFGIPAEGLAEDERENGFYIAVIASILGAMSAGLGCLARRVPEGSEQ